MPPRPHITIAEDTELRVAVPVVGTFAGRASVHVDELVDAPWIAGPSPSAKPMLGVWPGPPGRVRVVHSARDRLTKLHLVAGARFRNACRQFSHSA
ncbi:hypothetical protein [Amycolatopsis decaplanina]|uniref:LysR family transcriptional regulator n=1 Tax=Amycolatopsis decaplanina DSM 44594 TaxID=1284240 RepID=M2ZPE4_9PSEU|nr:hypothetical protein [Amycolatopsis decaplanina]EME62688.1 LysR family transcriptional regulator [Amycolatopsis decaplanina DSM 44594]